jgi:SAM-dependent methyltransferase
MKLSSDIDIIMGMKSTIVKQPHPALYDTIGVDYDTTRRADPYIVGRLFHHLNPKNYGKYLDLACGSGNYTVALKQSGLDIMGIDISAYMLHLAVGKESSTGWILGNIASLPFADGTFRGVSCILAIHHLRDLHSAFHEAARIINNGNLVIFTATAEQMEGYWLNEYFPEAMRKSILQMPRKKAIGNALQESGFRQIQWEPYEIRSDLQDFFLYSGKHNPVLYLEAGVRNGISTFSSIADAREIEKGCHLLKADVESGEIFRVIDSYSNREEGDYSFVIGQCGKRR